MKNFDIVKWAKDLSAELRSCPVPVGTTHNKDLRIYPHSQAMFIDSVLLPKLEEVFHTSSNSASLSCQSCKREHCSHSNPTCMACARFEGDRTDWHEQA